MRAEKTNKQSQTLSHEETSPDEDTPPLLLPQKGSKRAEIHTEERVPTITGKFVKQNASSGETVGGGKVSSQRKTNTQVLSRQPGDRNVHSENMKKKRKKRIDNVQIPPTLVAGPHSWT